VGCVYIVSYIHSDSAALPIRPRSHDYTEFCEESLEAFLKVYAALVPIEELRITDHVFVN